MDVLWVAENGIEAVIRASQRDAVKIMTSVVASTASPKMSLIKASAFLPSPLPNAI
jgi:hypothetical protein